MKRFEAIAEAIYASLMLSVARIYSKDAGGNHIRETTFSR